MKILVIAEHDNQELKGSTLNTVTAASEIGGEIDLLVAGFNCATVGEQATSVSGLSRVLVADDELYKNCLAENISLLIKDLGKDYSHILTPATSNGKNFKW